VTAVRHSTGASYTLLINLQQPGSIADHEPTVLVDL
jgi:hypothetical protein